MKHATKVLALMLAIILGLSLVACGSGSSAPAAGGGGDGVGDGDGGKLVVWALADDMKQFGERYHELTGVEVEVVVIAPADYPTKLQTAIRGNDSTVDIIMGEPQMLDEMYDYGAFADLDALGAGDYADKITDYVWELGKDDSGVQRAISYQVTPAGLYYRRDIAETVFGTSDPVEIGKLFSDYDTILETAQTLKDAGYRCFASDAEMDYFSRDEAWVIDGALNVSQGRKDYMDMVVKLYQGDLTAYCSSWSTPWYQAMGGPVPILSSDDNVWSEDFEKEHADDEKVEVFSFALPTWGTLTLRDHVGELSGKWGVCAGPHAGFGGGSFLGISELSKQKDLAWDFIKFCTLNEETADWWIEASEGDVVSLISAQEKHKDDENPVYRNQKLYAFWSEQAQYIDSSTVTRYDTAIGEAWGNAITKIKQGEATREEAINEFLDKVQSTYPDLTIDREAVLS